MWWLKLYVSTFHPFYTYSLPSKPSIVQVVNSEISDSFFNPVLTVSGELQYEWMVGGREGGFKKKESVRMN